MISDLDEIPNLNNFNFNEIGNHIVVFKQKMFYFKFNLFYENFDWYGSKAVKKKFYFSTMVKKYQKIRIILFGD